MIIKVWKIYHQNSPNDIGIKFYVNNRLGVKTRIPSLDKNAPSSAKTLVDSSFSVRATKLWNKLPKTVNTSDSLDTFKVLLGYFLRQFPDQPPVSGYTTQNSNSIIDWTNQSSGSQIDQRLC